MSTFVFSRKRHSPTTQVYTHKHIYTCIHTYVYVHVHVYLQHEPMLTGVYGPISEAFVESPTEDSPSTSRAVKRLSQHSVSPRLPLKGSFKGAIDIGIDFL